MHDVGKGDVIATGTPKGVACFGRSNNTGGYNWADGNEIVKDRGY